jgi:hypothetical protein
MGSPSNGTKNPAASQVLAKLQSLIAATIQIEHRQTVMLSGGKTRR